MLIKKSFLYRPSIDGGGIAVPTAPVADSVPASPSNGIAGTVTPVADSAPPIPPASPAKVDPANGVSSSPTQGDKTESVAGQPAQTADVLTARVAELEANLAEIRREAKRTREAAIKTTILSLAREAGIEHPEDVLNLEGAKKVSMDGDGGIVGAKEFIEQVVKSRPNWVKVQMVSFGTPANGVKWVGAPTSREIKIPRPLTRI